MIQVAWEPDPEQPDRLRIRRARPLFLPEGADDESPPTVSPESPLRRRVRLALRMLP